MPCEVSLAGQLMRQLLRYRAKSVSGRLTAHFYVTAIEGTVPHRCRETAATAYCIDTDILFRLEEISMRAELNGEMNSRKVPLNAVEQRWISNVFPDVVRQVAMVESGLPVTLLSYESSI